MIIYNNTPILLPILSACFTMSACCAFVYLRKYCFTSKPRYQKYPINPLNAEYSKILPNPRKRRHFRVIDDDVVTDLHGPVEIIKDALLVYALSKVYPERFKTHIFETKNDGNEIGSSPYDEDELSLPPLVSSNNHTLAFFEYMDPIMNDRIDDVKRFLKSELSYDNIEEFFEDFLYAIGRWRDMVTPSLHNTDEESAPDDVTSSIES